MNGTADGGCARVRARMAELVDGALAPLEEARDRGHLEACAACAAELAREERLRVLLRDAGGAELDADVARVSAAVREALERAPRPRRHVRATATLVALAAGVLFVALLDAGDAPAPELPRFSDWLARVPRPADALRGVESLRLELPR